MRCKNCGNIMYDGENFCGKCGAKFEKNNVKDNISKGTKEPIKIKFNHWLIAVIVCTIVLGLGVFIAINKPFENGIDIFNIFSKSAISTKEMTEILKSSDNGIYLQENTVKVGATSDIQYSNYNKLISYSATFKHNEVTLNAGGLLLYNTSTKGYKIISSLKTDFMAIIHYLNTENMNDKLNEVTKIVAKYIEQSDVFSDDTHQEQYAKMGKEIGQVVGVSLCRNIGRKGIEDLGNTSYSQATFLYEKDEIFLKYIGMNVTVQEYQWRGIMDELGAKLMANNNRSAYRNMIAFYGEPYKNVTKFIVFDYSNDNAKEVGRYDSVEKAKEKLNLE